MEESFDVVLADLRAVAESSRLRLLAILARGEFSVTELTRVLGQSQPRVSRHLKLLCDVGLLEKFREQHWIYYRVPAEGRGARFARDVIARLDPVDPVLTGDAERVAAILDERSRGGAGDAPVDPVELTAALADTLGDRGRANLFYYGASPGDVLAGISSRARNVVGMHPSRMEVQRARAALHSRGFSHCVLQQGDLAALPALSVRFDAAIIDRALVASARPVDGIREVARMLTGEGKLLLVEDYDALEERATDGNPIALLRAWLADAGLACRRVQPLDLDGHHLLLAVATFDRVAAAA
jgi:ArsR family transcriptional regulator